MSVRIFLLLLSLACTLPAADPLVKRTAGKYQVTLRLPQDGLFAQEESEIEFHLEDSSHPDPLTGAAPVIGATVDAAIEMPAMPGMPPFREVAHPESVPGDQDP